MALLLSGESECLFRKALFDSGERECLFCKALLVSGESECFLALPSGGPRPMGERPGGDMERLAAGGVRRGGGVRSADRGLRTIGGDPPSKEIKNYFKRFFQTEKLLANQYVFILGRFNYFLCFAPLTD